MKRMLRFKPSRRLSKDVDFSKEFEMIHRQKSGVGVGAFLSQLLVYQSLNDLNGRTNLQG